MNPEQAFPLVVALVLARILGLYQETFENVAPWFINRANLPPRDIIDGIQHRNLTDDQKLALFGSLTRYLRQIPPAYLCGELVGLERAASGWERNVRIDPQSLITMVFTLAISATHPDIDAQPLIDLFRPFVENHVIADPNLTPLLDILRRPENPRDVSVVWLAQIEASFRVLLQNVQRQRDSVLVQG